MTTTPPRHQCLPRLALVKPVVQPRPVLRLQARVRGAVLLRVEVVIDLGFGVTHALLQVPQLRVRRVHIVVHANVIQRLVDLSLEALVLRIEPHAVRPARGLCHTDSPNNWIVVRARGLQKARARPQPSANTPVVDLVPAQAHAGPSLVFRVAQLLVSRK